MMMVSHKCSSLGFTFEMGSYASSENGMSCGGDYNGLYNSIYKQEHHSQIKLLNQFAVSVEEKMIRECKIG